MVPYPQGDATDTETEFVKSAIDPTWAARSKVGSYDTNMWQHQQKMILTSVVIHSFWFLYAILLINSRWLTKAG